MKTIIPCVTSFLLVATLVFPSFAESIQEGYFKGADLQPLGDARTAMLLEEPAAVVLFTLDANNNAAVSKFDEWYRKPGNKGVSIYGVIVEPEKSMTIVSEVIDQRGLKMPLFFTSAKLLGSENIRAVLLDKGKARILPTPDPAVIEAALKGETPASVAVTPTPSPTPSVSVATETPAAAAVTTETILVETSPKSPLYSNRRFNFSVKFPSAWPPYWTAPNGDGAVSTSTAPLKFELRVWASPRDQQSVEKMPSTPREFAEQHLEFLGNQSKSQVVIERRLVVSDGELEGRDYTFRYLKPDASGSRKSSWRGRVQVFLVNGIFKVASVDAPSDQFEANRSIIEEYMLSFHPVLREEDEAISASRASGVPGPDERLEPRRGRAPVLVPAPGSNQ